MNSVQGTDYPYLYAVVLGKGSSASRGPGRATVHGVDLVFESARARACATRWSASTPTRRGGWHTEPGQIRGIVERGPRPGADGVAARTAEASPA